MQEELKQLRSKQRWDGILVVTLFVCLWFLVTLGYATMNNVHLVWLIPVMGWVQYYIVISGHEAVHKTLCPSKPLNEFIGVVGQAMVGVNFTAYRLQHMDHHRAPTHETDPDAHIYMGVLKQSPGIRRFIWLTLGTFIEILIKIRQKGVEGYGTNRNIKPKIQQSMRRDSVLVIVCQLMWMGLGWWLLNLGQWWPTSWMTLFEDYGVVGFCVKLGCELVASYALYWTVPLFFITVFLNRCRIVIEHGLALALVDDLSDFKGPRIPTVEVHPSKLEQWIFSPFLFNFHGSHHAYMTVPFYNLPKLNALMKVRFPNDDNPMGFLEYPKGYLRALWLVVNHEYTVSD
jgi:fatty acid desaturase